MLNFYHDFNLYKQQGLIYFWLFVYFFTLWFRNKEVSTPDLLSLLVMGMVTTVVVIAVKFSFQSGGHVGKCQIIGITLVHAAFV